MIVIVDYGVGNLNSVYNMIRKVGGKVLISGEPDVVNAATKLVLPGMGHFDNCMIRFRSSGLAAIIEEKVIEKKTPLLGICVGMQMFMHSSEEGVEKGLGWVKGKTIRFRMPGEANIKIPNMGWLDVRVENQTRISEGLDNARFYFAHSYHVDVDDKSDVLLTSDYGYTFVSGIARANLIGVQFHPEKSHRFGMALFKNFVDKY